MSNELNSLVKEEAEIIADRVNSNCKEYGFDPISILMIISIIISVLRLIQGCKKRSSEIKDISQMRFGKLRLHNVVYSVVGPLAYESHGKEIVDAIIDRAKEINENRVENLLAALDG